MPKRLILGPQRPVTNLGDAVAAAGFPSGPIAVISAAWQEAEGDIEEVQVQVKQPLIDLQLYGRAEEVFAADARLRDLYRQRQDELKELQRLYRLRLRQLLLAARLTLRADGEAAMIAAEVRHAVSQLRALDRHHLQRAKAINASYDREFARQGSDALAGHAAAIKRMLDDCETVLITGGNVVVLQNRLRLFGVHCLLDDRHLIAWSAGAMVLSERIVLYHDRTPQGRRDPEVLAPGAGLLPGYVFLPDARRRLRSNDTVRVDLLSRRFAPAACVTLDSGALLRFDGDRLQSAALARQIVSGGRLTRLAPA